MDEHDRIRSNVPVEFNFGFTLGGILLHLVGSPTQAPRVDTMHARDVSAIGSLKVVPSLRTETNKKGVNYGI